MHSSTEGTIVVKDITSCNASCYFILQPSPVEFVAVPSLAFFFGESVDLMTLEVCSIYDNGTRITCVVNEPLAETYL